MSKPKAAIFADNPAWYAGDILDYVYGTRRLDQLGELCDLHARRIVSGNLIHELPALGDVEVIFSCWGMPAITKAHLAQMPRLKAVFYAGGAIQGFARPFLERGVIVCGAMEANAIPVAEFCLGQILLACKGVHRNSALCRRGPWRQRDMPTGKGVYGETVALIGIGTVSRHLLRLLRPFKLRVIAMSEYLTSEQASELGIDELVDIETAFREGYVISNHLPDIPSTVGALTGEHFASMRPGATFLNTGRGAQVDEAGLIAALRTRPDITALLDVQHPEPPLAGSELYTLPNVQLTSHIAGSVHDEAGRMADYMIDEFQRWRAGQPLRYRADPDTFAVSV